MDRFYYNKDLGICITFSGLLWLGYSENTLKSASSRRSSSWPFVVHPEDARRRILPYESCPPNRKADISARLAKRMGCKHLEGGCKCGDVYYYTAIQPIRRMIVKDIKAEEFFLAYRYKGTNGYPEALPSEKVQQYTNEASILNFIVQVDEDTKGIVKEKLGFKSVADFWTKIIDIIKDEKYAGRVTAKFPTSYVRLVSYRESLLKRYKEKGYEALIHGSYGKMSNASKVTDIAAEQKLLSLIEDPRQLDDVYVSFVYNAWAKEAGYKAISPATVGLWRRKRAAEVDLLRYGRSAYNERYIRQVKGMRPSSPLYLVEHDDNNLDFLFQDGKYQFHKYVAVVVADSFNDLVLGYSYVPGDVPQQWQVAHAYLSAMYYIRSLTGGWHLPFEIKSDNWANKSLAPFYEKIATRIPAGHSNKHRGYIEQLFGSPHWKRCQQTVSLDNWTGNNITARHSGVNPDILMQSMRDKTRPMLGSEAELQIEQFFTLTRKLPAITRNDLNAHSKEQQWLEAWNNMHPDDRRPITDDMFLYKFGITHKPKHTSTIMINNRGVEPQINGVRYSYDLPETWMYQKYIGAQVEVVYDPYDMSRILVTNHDDIRFVARSAVLSPRALKDSYTGARTFLNAILAEKTEHWKAAAEAVEARKEVRNGFATAEAILKSGILVKDVKNAAEQAILAAPSQSQDEDAYSQWIDDSYDFKQFFE